MRKLILIILLITTSVSHAQYVKINIGLKYALNQQKDPDALFPLFVMGNVSQIKQEVELLQGKVIRSTKNIVQVELPVKTIEEFSKNTFVQSIPYSFSKGRLMCDTMTIHNNVTPVHNGVSPLLQSYTGKNVVFGIIDTGHDIVHPDFKDTLGNTRIYRIWDQVSNLYWDSTSINNSTCTHVDYGGTSHGTHVSGIAAGNGLALNNYTGVAGEATIVAVASDFNAPNWLSTVVDAAAYIYSVADSLGLPCVINASIGDYYGSHDGSDPAAQLIDSLLNYKPGRVFVGAGGNAGSFNWHLEHQVGSDTTFTWMKYNASSALGVGAVVYEVWADTADFNQVDFALGANLPSGSFSERGRTAFANIQNRMGTHYDTILSPNLDTIAFVETFGDLQDDKYLLQVFMIEPDSNTYNFSLLTTGSGRLDVWTSNVFGTSAMVQSGLPSAGVYPPIIHYVMPDSAKTIVSSFQCSPNVITVANFENRKTYIDVDTILRIKPNIPGRIANSSSHGPDRRGNIKPDIGATGDATLGANSAAVIAANLIAGPAERLKVALGGMHRINGGTSMASPVVAGVVALYLEKCPNADHNEIKSALLNTAKIDTFTGAVPNNAIGYGKVDAMAALLSSNYTLTLGADADICDGDSVQISAPAYTSYSWSNGDSTQNTWVDSTIQLYVTVSNTSGCKARSDTVNITWHPLPVKPVISVLGNDSLQYLTNLNMQWYFNNSPISGANDTLHVAQNTGDYFVQVTDSFGCQNNSDTVQVIMLGIENFDQDVATVYPNPTNGQLTVVLNQNKLQAIQILDGSGKLVYDHQVKANEKQLSIDLTALAEGSYFLKLRSADQEYTKQIILLR